MPRGNQVTRQWHLLRRLESPRGATLQELVAAVPEECARHPRTVRRDLEALEGAGFPLFSERVDGEVRWKLMEGFRHIPALAFSPTELMALTLSRSLLKPLEGTQVHGALDSALAKAASALPPPGLGYVRQLQDLFAVGLGPHKSYREHRQTVDRLTEAIGRARTVRMRYYSASRNVTTRREVDPYRLWYAAGGLYLVAYCHRRREVRLFAVDRVRSLLLTDHPYQMPLNFDLEAYVRDALVVMRGRAAPVELLFNKATATWVKDRLWHPSQTLSRLKDGRMRMTLMVAQTRELVGWILSFGGGVRVVSPPSLREAVRAEARRILEQE